MIRVRITERYRKSERRVPERIRIKARDALSGLLENPQRPGLNFERLSGWDDTYSIRVTREYRILLMRESDEEGEVLAAIDIGTHRVYRR